MTDRSPKIVMMAYFHENKNIHPIDFANSTRSAALIWRNQPVYYIFNYSLQPPPPPPLENKSFDIVGGTLEVILQHSKISVT